MIIKECQCKRRIHWWEISQGKKKIIIFIWSALKWDMWYMLLYIIICVINMLRILFFFCVSQLSERLHMIYSHKQRGVHRMMGWRREARGEDTQMSVDEIIEFVVDELESMSSPVSLLQLWMSCLSRWSWDNCTKSAQLCRYTQRGGIHTNTHTHLISHRLLC